jgi:hypothetical protein
MICYKYYLPSVQHLCLLLLGWIEDHEKIGTNAYGKSGRIGRHVVVGT